MAGYTEGLTLMQLKEVAGTSQAHLTLEKPVGDCGMWLGYSRQGLLPKCLSHSPQGPPSEPQWQSVSPRKGVESVRPTGSMSNLCLLWASWIRKKNFAGQKNVPSKRSFVIWVGLLTTLYFAWVLLCQLGWGLSEEGNQPGWKRILHCVCFTKTLPGTISPVHFPSTCLLVSGCAETQRQAQGHLFRKWLSWDSNS